MATFRIGQRVRLIACSQHQELIGREATIVEIPGFFCDCAIEIDGVDPAAYGYNRGPWLCSFSYLAPLTDPRADEFIADMVRFAHLSKQKEAA